VAESSSETRTRWERRRERTHGRLLHAAEHLFRTQGFEATTVEEIAAAADVAKGTFFNYFASKETLLGELLYLRIQPLLDRMMDGEGGVMERIWTLLHDVRLELDPYVHLFQRMALFILTNPLSDCSTAEHLSLAGALTRLVRVGQEEGTFRRDSDAEAAGTLIATYFFRLSVLECLRTAQDAFCWEDRMRAALDIVYGGLAAHR